MTQLACYHYAIDFPNGDRKFGRTYQFTADEAFEAVYSLKEELGGADMHGPYISKEQLAEAIYCKENDV